MSVVDFITNNPDLVTLVVGAVTGLVWKKGKSIREADLWDTLLQVGRQAFPLLLKSAKLYDDEYVREVVTQKITAGLKRLGVPINATVQRLIDEAVEHVIGELAAMVIKYHFEQFTKTQKETLAILKSAPEPLGPIGQEP